MFRLPPVFLNRYCKLNSTVHPGTGHCPALNWPVQKHRGEPGHTGRVSHRAHRPRIPRSIRPTRHRQTHNNLTTDSCDSTQTHGVGDLTRPRPGASYLDNVPCAPRPTHTQCQKRPPLQTQPWLSYPLPLPRVTTVGIKIRWQQSCSAVASACARCLCEVAQALVQASFGCWTTRHAFDYCDLDLSPERALTQK